MFDAWWPALVFAAVALTVFALLDLGRVRPRPRAAAPTQPSLDFEASGSLQRLLVQPLRSFLLADRETHAVRRRLQRAGFYSPHAVGAYFATRLILGGGLPILVNPLISLVGGQLPVRLSTTIAIIAALLGYGLPSLFLALRIGRRQQAVRRALPDALDLLVICVESGLGLDGAIARVGQEIRTAHPLIGEHFAMLSAELRAGRQRDEAWRTMATRIGIDEVSSLVTLLVQSEKLGTSAADALRSHARTLRARRLLRAEEKAQQLGVKMTFPLILLILPALMVVIATPAMIRTYRQLVTVFERPAP